MRVTILIDSQMRLGGGFTFIENFKKAIANQYTDYIEKADIALIPGATAVLPETIDKAKNLGCKVVLRLDGIPEDWRNSGRGWDRLLNAYKKADGVVSQSAYITNGVLDILHSATAVSKPWIEIMNGVDTDIFNTRAKPRPRNKGNYKLILNVNSRKDPNKRIETIIENFRLRKTKNPDDVLIFAGKYPSYLKNHDFGMYMFKRGKDWDYIGEIKDRHTLASTLISADYFAFPSEFDPCPNILIEAIHCGVQPLWLSMTGAVPEIINLWNTGYDFCLDNMGKQYILFFEHLCRV